MARRNRANPGFSAVRAHPGATRVSGRYWSKNTRLAAVAVPGFAQTLKKKAFPHFWRRKNACVSALVCYFSRRSQPRVQRSRQKPRFLPAVYRVRSAEMPQALQPIHCAVRAARDDTTFEE
jgi:hypothetical protein